MQNFDNDYIYCQWHFPIPPQDLYIRTLQCIFFCRPVALVVINLLVRQFGPEEVFLWTWNRIGMRCSWVSHPPASQSEEDCFNWPSDECDAYGWASTFCGSLSHSLSLSISIFLHSITILRFPPCSSHSPVLPLFVTVFLSFCPIRSLCLSHRTYCNWLYLPPPCFLPPCLPVFLLTVDKLLMARAGGDLLSGPRAATQDMGPASAPRSCLVLQPVELPVRVSLPICLPFADGLISQNRWIPPTADPLTLLLTSHQACASSLSFFSAVVKINISSPLTL